MPIHERHKLLVTSIQFVRCHYPIALAICCKASQKASQDAISMIKSCKLCILSQAGTSIPYRNTFPYTGSLQLVPQDSKDNFIWGLYCIKSQKSKSDASNANV